MTDLAKVARAVTAKSLEYFVRAGGPGQSGHGGIRCGFIPILHGLDERRFGFVRRGHFGFVHCAHRPIAFARVLRLGGFEGVERPENGEPAVGIRRGNAGKVSGIDDQHGVKFEADRARLNVPDPCEEQCGQQLPIAQSPANAKRDLFQEAVTRRILKQMDKGLNLGLQANDFGVKPGFLGGDSRQARQER